MKKLICIAAVAAISMGTVFASVPVKAAKDTTVKMMDTSKMKMKKMKTQKKMKKDSMKMKMKMKKDTAKM